MFAEIGRICSVSRPLDAVGVLRSLNPTLRPRLDEICVEVTRLDAAEEELGPGEAADNELEAAAPLAGP